MVITPLLFLIWNFNLVVLRWGRIHNNGGFFTLAGILKGIFGDIASLSVLLYVRNERCW